MKTLKTLPQKLVKKSTDQENQRNKKIRCKSYIFNIC